MKDIAESIGKKCNTILTIMVDSPETKNHVGVV